MDGLVGAVLGSFQYNINIGKYEIPDNKSIDKMENQTKPTNQPENSE